MINNNYFAYVNKIHKQNNRALMGYLTSIIIRLLSEFILQFLEEDIYKLDYTYCTLIRYVDDILFKWKHTDILLNDFLDQINILHFNINFTLEIYKNNILS